MAGSVDGSILILVHQPGIAVRAVLCSTEVMALTQLLEKFEFRSLKCWMKALHVKRRDLESIMAD